MLVNAHVRIPVTELVLKVLDNGGFLLLAAVAAYVPGQLPACNKVQICMESESVVWEQNVCSQNDVTVAGA